MDIAALEGLQVTTRSDAEKLIRTVLDGPFPLAIWKHPYESQVYALISLDTPRHLADGSLEELHESFVLNGYDVSHPPRPLVLSGDVIITLEGPHAHMRLKPSLSAARLDHFCSSLRRMEKVPPSPLLPGTSQMDFEQLVAQALNEIHAGQLEKVVLSRYTDDALPEGFDACQAFESLTVRYPGAFCYLTKTAAYGLWLGATPEKLIGIHQQRFFSTDALAGTVQLTGEQKLSQVAWTQKEIEEQAMVSRYVIGCFKQIRLREFDEVGPKTIKAGNLAHLKTEFSVDMQATNTPHLGSTMLRLLHPTSAVCGYPREAADAFIKTHEGYDRSLYAGFLGPVGFEGNTQLFVNLRCMKMDAVQARLFAGAGITEDSEPASELRETEYKMQTLRNVLGK